MAESLKARAKKIKLIAMDVDGVLTRGDIILLESSEEVKFWNAKDRLGLAAIRDAKIPVIFAWITGRKSNAVAWAAEDLGVKYLVQKCHDKKQALLSILHENNLTPSQAAFIGDDLIDISALRAVGFAACPADAVPDVKKYAHYISKLKGGEGIVRDVCEFILKAQGQWNGLLKPFLQ